MDNSLETSDINEFITKYSPYLQEIRKRLLLTIGVLIVGSIAGFIFYERIIKLIIEILNLKEVNIVFTSPFQFINLAISCGIAVGLILAFPLIIYQVFSFLKPALRDKEFKMLVRFLPFSIVLFLVGFIFGLMVMKWQIELFLTKSVALGIGNILDISKLIGTVLLVSVIMGLAFQFPIVISLLTQLGIIKHSQLAKVRLWVYLGTLLFTILLPLDSILADFLLALPLIGLYELTLLLNLVYEKKNKKESITPLR